MAEKLTFEKLVSICKVATDRQIGSGLSVYGSYGLAERIALDVWRDHLKESEIAATEPEQPTPAAEVIIELSKRVSALEEQMKRCRQPIYPDQEPGNRILGDQSFTVTYTDAGL